MIQYPKQEHVTLPSVESWGASMNILKDPPKSVWTRQINKVNEASEITRMIGEDNGSRICEMIKVYPRGINPMVSVSYSNYGTNGGQNRNVTGAGIFGSNKSCRDGRSAYLGQAKLPYPAVHDGAFRPPVWRQEDLLPLSRLPRTNTSAWTSPGFVNYAKSASCAKPEKLRQVIEEPVRHTVRPTKIITIQRPLVEPFEIRHVIENPVHTSVVSIKRGADRSHHTNSDVNGRTKVTLEGEIVLNKNAQRQVERVIQDLNPERYTAEVSYYDIRTRSTRQVAQGLQESKGKSRAIGQSMNLEVDSRKTREGARLLEPSETGKDRAIQNVQYTEVSAAKSQQRTQATLPGRGNTSAIQDVLYMDIGSAKTYPGGKVPDRATKGRLSAVGDRIYQEVGSKRTREGAQILQEGKHGKQHTVNVVYSNVSVNKGRQISLPFEETRHGKTNIKNVLHISANAGINIPNAEPLKEVRLAELERGLPRYEATARRTSSAYHKNTEGVHVYPLERKTPMSSVTTNRGRSGLGVDTYRNQSRHGRIKQTLSTGAGFEGRGTIPRMVTEQAPRKLHNEARSHLLRQAHLAGLGRA